MRRAVRHVKAAAGRVVHRHNGDLEELRVQMGDIQARLIRDLRPDQVEFAEIKVFSQFGEDGIIQFLVQRVPIAERIFVEFGVEDYREANTRFLMMHDGWRGLIIDADSAHRRFLEASGAAWRWHVDAVTSLIDRENIDSLIRSAGIEGDIGLLSVDIDGNDLWVLGAIESVSPRILVTEYNSLFGPELRVSVPYDARFVRGEKHSSHLYWGASLAALTDVAERKGYALVAGNRAGNNAFFVRRDVLGAVPERPVAECWRPAQFRESRGPGGELTYLSDDEEKLRLIRDLPLVDLDDGERLATVGELYGLDQ